MQETDLLIVGAGPVGLSLALALADSGLDITLVDARGAGAAADDPRTLALSHGSRLALERLGVWQGLPATPIETIHVSQQGSLGRTLIRASEEGVPALGHVVAAGALARALEQAVRARGIRVLNHRELRHSHEQAVPHGERLSVTLHDTHPEAPAGENTQGESFRPRLLACAEGGLQAGQPDVVEQDYGQHALIGFIDSPGARERIAYERFTAHGPLALLPCGERFALVHVCRPEQADALMALEAAEYLARLQAIIGRRVQLQGIGERHRYPLLLRYRQHPVGERTVWLGNAAQTLHPVAGQGFNLALRDVWALTETLLHTHRRPPTDPGAPALLASFARQRQLDRSATIRFTDGLIRVFSNDIAPLHHLRGAGLFALDLFPPLRSFIARRMMFGARAWP